MKARSSRTDKLVLGTAWFRTWLTIWTPGLASSTTAGGLTDTFTKPTSTDSTAGCLVEVCIASSLPSVHTAMSTIKQLEALWAAALETTSLVAAFSIQAGLRVLAFVDVRAVSPGLIESVACVADAKEVALLVLALPVGTNLIKELTLVDVPTLLFPARPGNV